MKDPDMYLKLFIVSNDSFKNINDTYISYNN